MRGRRSGSYPNPDHNGDIDGYIHADLHANAGTDRDFNSNDYVHASSAFH